MTTELAKWADAWESLLSAWTRFGEVISSRPPDGALPAAALPVLLKIWGKLGVGAFALENDPAGATARAWSSRVAGDYAKDAVNDGVGAVVRDLERRIGTALTRGAADPSVIPTSDFGSGAGLQTADLGYFNPASGRPLPFVLGVVSSLPAGSKWRELVPLADLYRSGGLLEAIVLGPVDPSGRAREWYASASAAAFTRSARATQKLREEERLEDERREAERSRREWHQSEIGMLRAKLRLLEQLEREGKVPSETPTPPAVRIGRN
jgi:hypothetical protein